MCQDTGTAIVKAKKGQYVFTGGGDEAAIAARRLQHVPHDEPALQPDGAADDVRRGQHRQQPAGRDQDRRGRRRRLQVPVHGQGRRQRQQELPVPGDQGAAQREDAAAVAVREDEDARHRGLPAVPPRRRHRRHVGRVRRGDGQAGLDPLPRHAADRRARPAGHAFRDVELEAKVLELAQQTGIGAQFGGKYFCHDVRIIRLPRHGASCPVGMAVSCCADRQALGKITARRRVPRAARDRPGALPARRDRTSDLDERRRSCTSTSTGRWPRSAPSCASTR